MKILTIVPAYNEAGSIEATITHIRAVDLDLEIVVIDDCSTDQTAALAYAAGVDVVRLPINLGIGGAVQTGFRFAVDNHFDIAVQVDGDGQHDPAFIPNLIAPILEDRADVVVGSRFIRREGFQSLFMRRLGIRLFQHLNRLLIRQKITDSTSGFRAYNAAALRVLQHNYPVDYPEPEALVLLKKRRFRLAEVPVLMRNRHAGESSISGWKSIYYMIKVTLSILIESVRLPDG
ncbi:MAG: glycosyltransferase family 2 protein [Candidatus Aminicenantes bacterium]|nr:glycosyltransferase family 2 protein [Candidatus Aminicenantes bacterium]